MGRGPRNNLLDFVGDPILRRLFRPDFSAAVCAARVLLVAYYFTRVIGFGLIQFFNIPGVLEHSSCCCSNPP